MDILLGKEHCVLFRNQLSYTGQKIQDKEKMHRGDNKKKLILA